MCLVFGCPPNEKKHFTESANLYRWAFNNFSYKEVANSTEPICEMPVELSLETDFVSLYFKKPFVTILPNAADDSTLVVKTNLKAESVEAPVKKGDVLGEAEIYYAEKVIGKVDLVAGADVEKSKLLSIMQHVKNFFVSKYMKIVYLVICLIIVAFILWCIVLNLGKKKKRRKVRYIPYNPDKDN